MTVNNKLMKYRISLYECGGAYAFVLNKMFEIRVGLGLSFSRSLSLLLIVPYKILCYTVICLSSLSRL